MLKLIGFDATEHHRAGGGGTYAMNAMGQNIAAKPDIPHFKDRYRVEYWLRKWGWDRDKCMRVIADAGLPIPPKSACFMCPAMSKIEILQLKETNPAQYELAMAMEALYRSGEHFRGDDFFTVTAKRKDTGEKVKFESRAASAAGAREHFRKAYNDTARPYRYEVRVSQAVVGLGRNFKWESVQ